MGDIYLDHNATTPIDPRVLECMLPFLREQFGNASSKHHAYGWTANEAVETARGHVATLLGARPREIVFTAGATESNNIALAGVVDYDYLKEGRSERRPRHVITQATEHPAVLDTTRALERRGHRVTYLKPDRTGLVTADDVRGAMRDDTVLVSIMAANNEIGTVQPIAEIGAVCEELGVLFHTDAAQAAGKIPLDIGSMHIDLLALSGHKFYAPKGIGALCVRTRTPRTKITGIAYGGGQERSLRPGTLDVPGIVALGEAARLATLELEAESERLRSLRDRLVDHLKAQLDGLHFHHDPISGLPGTASVSFEGVDGAALLVALKGIAVSSGSACASGSTSPSHVLKALGVADRLAAATLRFGVGRSTTVEQVDAAAESVVAAVSQMRAQRAPERRR